MRETVVGEPFAGMRLDRALANLAGLGLRGARRMIVDGSVLLNGRAAAKGALVRAGDRIEFADTAQAQRQCGLFGTQGAYCFFYKPAGMHTTALAGRNNGSLEQCLPALCAERQLPPGIQLLQRLDFGTSGLVCGAMNKAAADAYRYWQKLGKCSKFYYAALSGRLDHAVTARFALMGSGKRMTCGREAGEPLRWTEFEPLWQGELNGYGEVTLARCLIRSGQRHQIRAHAQVIGHPLAGDGLYGAGEALDNFLLSHYRLEFPGHRALWRDVAFMGRFPQLAVWED